MSLPTQEVYDFVWVLNSTWNLHIDQEFSRRELGFIRLFQFCPHLR